MKTELDVNLENKTAYLDLDYFSMTVEDDSQRGAIVSGLSQIKDLIISVSGNKISVAIRYNFGIHIPDKIWNMRKSSFIDGFSDRGLSYEWEKICKEMILEYVKEILPSVLKSLRESANIFIEKYN